ISNRCANNCLYCGFRQENEPAVRQTLTRSEIVREAACLFDRGYRRLLLVAGEDRVSSSLNYLIDAIRGIYTETGIRIVHVNAAPMTMEAFSELKRAGAGVYQCFQETYHRATYARMHPRGPKSNFDWRFSVMHRAMAAGFDDVGMGALFGLYDYRFEVLSLIAHARALEEDYGVGPHTVSVPRLQPAQGAALSKVPYPVSDETFKTIVATLRLAIPYAGVVVSTRESAPLRDQVIRCGVSQISAGSRTDIGGYTGENKRLSRTAQFSLSDQRTLDETVRAVMAAGLTPSLCTACYRSGRTGETFRSAAERGELGNLCDINAILSLVEYMGGHADPQTRGRIKAHIGHLIRSMDDPRRRREIEDLLNGEDRQAEDLHF
ncbi:MAG: [FeFe] hydrogenase H-cluster radical SAM maturase HydG, partial [bacterium]|nr:[FeFe] hydrogenase H-cluster radical SAM maturase HydG [bacterium]